MFDYLYVRVKLTYFLKTRYRKLSFHSCKNWKDFLNLVLNSGIVSLEIFAALEGIGNFHVLIIFKQIILNLPQKTLHCSEEKYPCGVLSPLNSPFPVLAVPAFGKTDHRNEGLKHPENILRPCQRSQNLFRV